MPSRPQSSLRQQNKAKVRASILAAAQQLIDDNGASQITTRDIAKAAGVSYQTLYNYFSSKSKVLYGVMLQDLQAWTITVEQIIKQYNGDLLGTLAAINETMVAQVSGAHAEIWLEIGARLFDQSDERIELTALNHVAHERYHALLSMAQGTGELRREVDLHLLAHTLYGLSDYAFLNLLLSRIADPASFSQTLAEQFKLVVGPYLTNRITGD